MVPKQLQLADGHRLTNYHPDKLVRLWPQEGNWEAVRCEISQ